MIQASMLGVRKESRCSASQVYALRSKLLRNLGPTEVSTKANGCLSFPKHFLFCRNCSIPLQLQLNYFHTTCFVDYDFDCQFGQAPSCLLLLLHTIVNIRCRK